MAKSAGIVSAVPELGQHTEEVLLSLEGYSWEDSEQLQEREVV